MRSKKQKKFLTFFLISGVLAAFASTFFYKLNSENMRLAPFGYTYDGKAFSGVVYEAYSLWNLKSISFLFNGKRFGPELRWSVNRQRTLEKYYWNGLEIGQEKRWFANGKVRSLKSFKNGISDGEFFDWHSNGTLLQYVVYDHGQELAAKSWTANGKPFYNYVWHEDRTIGLQGDTYCKPRTR